MSSSMLRSRLKYSRLNLNIDASEKEGQFAPRPSWLKENRNVSLFWLEKISLVVWYLQVHAIIWLIGAQLGESSFSSAWLNAWCWSLFSTVDVASFIVNLGSSASFDAQSVIVILLPCAAFVAYLVIMKRFAKMEKAKEKSESDVDAISESDPFNPASETDSIIAANAAAVAAAKPRRRWSLSQMEFQIYYLYFLEFLYIPSLVVTFRAILCGGDSATGSLVMGGVTQLELDWNFGCFSSFPRLIFLIFVLLTQLPFLLFLPFHFYQKGISGVLFADGNSHEKYLKCRELEFLLGINAFFANDRLFYISSFRRRFLHARSFFCLQKFALCAAAFLLLNYQKASTILVFFALCVPAVFKLFSPQFRCDSTNGVRFALDSALVFSGLFAIFAACNFLTGQTLFAAFLIVNLLGIAGSVIASGAFAGCLRCCKKKGSAASGAVQGRENWPVTETEIGALLKTQPDYLKAINAGKRLIETSRHVSVEYLPLPALLEAIQSARAILFEIQWKRDGAGALNSVDAAAVQNWREKNQKKAQTKERERRRGRAPGGVSPASDKLTVKTAETLVSALEWTLQDMLEELALLYNSVLAKVGEAEAEASAGDEGKNVAGAVPSNAADAAAVTAAVAAFGNAWEKKKEERLLMRDEKRRALSRLFTLRALLSDSFISAAARKPFSGKIVQETPEEERKAELEEAAQEKTHKLGAGDELEDELDDYEDDDDEDDDEEDDEEANDANDMESDYAEDYENQDNAAAKEDNE